MKTTQLKMGDRVELVFCNIEPFVAGRTGTIVAAKSGDSRATVQLDGMTCTRTLNRQCFAPIAS